MVVTLLFKRLFVFKHLMARFETTDIGCSWHEAALPQAIIPYCAREFIKLWYNIRNAWLLTQCLTLYITPTYLDIVQHNYLQCSFQVSFSSTIIPRDLQVKAFSIRLRLTFTAKDSVLTCL